MKTLSRSLNRLVAGLGMPGILGLGLLAFCAAFYASTLAPQRTHLEELRLEADRRERKRPPTLDEDPGYSREALGAFYSFFPPSNHLSDQIRKIYAAAERQNVQLEQGDYRASKDSAGELVRYQISLPLKGSYTQIRKFIAAVLSDLPNVSLESIQFERQRVGDPTVEAKIKLVMFLGRRS